MAACELVQVYHTVKILFIDNDTSLINDDIEVYFYFLSHILQFFNLCINKLQGNNISITDVFDVMNNLKESLSSRLVDNFYGYQTNQLLDKSSKKKCILKDFNNFLQNAIDYLNKWFDFSNDNWLKYVKCIQINDKIVYQDICKLIEKLNLVEMLTLNMDSLYEECRVVNILMETLKEPIQNVCEKWQYLFNSCQSTNGNLEQLMNIYKIVSFIYSIPPTSSFCERIFSINKLKYREERNRCQLNLIKYELMISLNNSESCIEVYDKFIQNKKLLEASKSSKKYIFKQKK